MTSPDDVVTFDDGEIFVELLPAGYVFIIQENGYEVEGCVSIRDDVWGKVVTAVDSARQKGDDK